MHGHESCCKMPPTGSDQSRDGPMSSASSVTNISVLDAAGSWPTWDGSWRKVDNRNRISHHSLPLQNSAAKQLVESSIRCISPSSSLPFAPGYTPVQCSYASTRGWRSSGHTTDVTPSTIGRFLVRVSSCAGVQDRHDVSGW